MNKNHRNLYIITVIISIIMSLFSQVTFAVEVEIQPVLEGKEYYIMKLGELETFIAYGFGWDEQTEQKIPDAEITEIHWTFDSRFLELVQTQDNTITLKAIKARTSRLTVTGKINGESVSKTIFIVINANDR